ncbi:MAG: hypothetical protein GX591_02225 [Planctomycetes bacterium]|nr:hypothetical protein [Planctomycetota bacterium]
MVEVTHTHTTHRHPAILGAVAITLGILALLAPLLAGSVVALMLGVLLIVGGIMRFVWAFEAHSFGRGTLLFVLGGLMALGGLALLFRPLYAIDVLTVILAVYFIVDGIVEIIAGVRRHATTAGWGWLLFSGIVSILLGVLLWSIRVDDFLALVGILVGIKLIFTGVVIIASGAEHAMPRAA